MKFYPIALLALFSLACNQQKESQPKSEIDDVALIAEIQGTLAVLPEAIIDIEKNKELINLGKQLYFEKKLSINDTISCNSCHQLDKYGVDNNPTSPGHNGTLGGRNSPTVYNAALYFAQFWDGRAANVEEQALGPILNPIEHGLPDEASAMKKIDSPEYRSLFAKAFGNSDSFTYKNVGVAIGAFEKTLLTPSRFDDYLKGDHSALTENEKRGLKRFNEIGCSSCHEGAAVGGTTFQLLGAVEAYETSDMGRYEVTKNEADKKFFKVPSLRNVTKTGPYFHDGSIATIDEAIRLMGKHQLGEALSQQDIADIKAFLGSLEAKQLPVISEK